MVQVRKGLGLVSSFGDGDAPSEATEPTTYSTSTHGTAPQSSSPDPARSAAVAAANAAAGAHAEAHHALQERLNEAIAAGQQAIAEDRQILKLPRVEQDASKSSSLAPTINQMLELAANTSQSQNASTSPSQPVNMSRSQVPYGSTGATASPHQQVPKSASVLSTSSTEDLPELLSTENHMHVQASATTRRVADALQGAVNAEQEAQTLEAQAAELRANAELILQRGAATAEKASAEAANQTAQQAFSVLSEIEQQAESLEISAASYRAQANSASQQANAAVKNMYRALNMSNTKQ
jgi:hypothetical protein